ncbi:hypothetical protein BDV97DRAFT_399140 [Delphinella strobiligena]|nr:hypothetical protein BDV97DRAFT_399140 [Delphinella strobiligena]
MLLTTPLLALLAATTAIALPSPTSLFGSAFFGTSYPNYNMTVGSGTGAPGNRHGVTGPSGTHHGVHWKRFLPLSFSSSPEDRVAAAALEARQADVFERAKRAPSGSSAIDFSNWNRDQLGALLEGLRDEEGKGVRAFNLTTQDLGDGRKEGLVRAVEGWISRKYNS